MKFLPLAMSEMGGEGICVAGVDVNSLQWIRPVVRNYGCLFTEQAQRFRANTIHKLELGSRQIRAPSKDPFERHTEDRILRDVDVLSSVDPTQKRALLVLLADSDLEKALLTPSRSLFLVKPNRYQAVKDQDDIWRWEFHAGAASVSVLRRASTLSELHTGISSGGIECTCPQWRTFASEKFADPRQVSESDISALPESPILYLTLSLSSVEFEKYWIMIAGVHVIGETRIWL